MNRTPKPTTPNFTTCHGSGQRATSFAGDYMKCPACREWVRDLLEGDPFILPRHVGATPRDIADAASIIRWEYRQARKNGTLHSDPNRWHTTALAMVRAGRPA